MRELLRDATYIRYWLAVVVSFFGDAMTRVTLIYVTATLTEDPVMIALIVLAQLLPSGLLGAFVGPLADRVSKRTLLVGADLARIVVVLAMILALDSVWLLVALTFLQGVGKAFFETARIAAVPKIVGMERIPVAVALFQSTNHVVNLIGPALGGVLIAIGSVSAVLVIDAATFLVSALLLASMAVLREVPATGATVEGYWQSMRSGIRGVLEIPSLRFVGMVTIPVTIVLGLFTTNFNAQLLTVFDLPAVDYGLAQATLAGGAVLGALLGPVLIRRYQSANALLLVSVGMFGLALVWLAPTQWLWDDLGLPAVIQWCVLAGLFSSLFQVPIANTLLRDLPEALRGRGVGLFNTIMMNFTVLGVAIGGVTASLFGVASSLIVAGVALAVFAALSFRTLRPVQSEELGVPVKS
jgi:MFS family permease